MRIPALRHRRHPILPRRNRSNVRRALAFAAASRPDLGRERASRRSSSSVEDIELHTPLAAVSGVYEGPAGIRRFFADVEDAAPDFRLNLERIQEISANQVLTFMNITATGRASGLPTETPTANVYELASGKIRRLQIFADRQRALEAVGLRE